MSNGRRSFFREHEKVSRSRVCCQFPMYSTPDLGQAKRLEQLLSLHAPNPCHAHSLHEHSVRYLGPASQCPRTPPPPTPADFWEEFWYWLYLYIIWCVRDDRRGCGQPGPIGLWVSGKWAQTLDGTSSSRDGEEPRGTLVYTGGASAVSILEVIPSAEVVRQNPKCGGNALSLSLTTLKMEHAWGAWVA